jgi:hypothetical protein
VKTSEACNLFCASKPQVISTEMAFFHAERLDGGITVGKIHNYLCTALLSDRATIEDKFSQLCGQSICLQQTSNAHALRKCDIAVGYFQALGPSSKGPWEEAGHDRRVSFAHR